MAEYAVNTVHLRQYAQRIAVLRGELDSVAVQLGTMQLGSVLRINATTALIGKIGDCKIAVAHQSQDLNALAHGLEEVAALYEENEKALSVPNSVSVLPVPGTGAGAGIASESGGNIWGNVATNTVNWFGSKCVPLGLASAIMEFSKGTPLGAVKGTKGLLGALGNGTKAVFNSNGNINADWGLRMLGFQAQEVTGLGDAFTRFCDSMNLSKQTTTAGKVSTLCKWGGYALTFAASGVENYEEYGGDLTSMGFWGETIVEGAVDVGLSIGAGLLVAAALPATAPAIVVGAVGAGVVWAANEICEAFTGEDIAENISTLASNAVQDLGDAIQGAAETTRSAIDSVCKWVGGLFD